MNKQEYQKYLLLKRNEKKITAKLRPVRKKIPNLLERVREHVIWLRNHGTEDAKKNRKYFFGYITKEKIAEHFGVSQGEIQHCFQQLNLEGLLSQAIKGDRYEGWVPDKYHINDYVSLPDDEKEIKAFDYENCPICDEKLIDESRHIYKKLCSNKCFEHTFRQNGNVVKIFNKEFIFLEKTNSKGQINLVKNNMIKEIAHWKKNYRYLLKILED